MMNIAFDYLYRDAGNYKRWERVVFSNPNLRQVDEIRTLIRAVIADAMYFDAPAVRLPDVHFREYSPNLDIPLHEFFEVSETDLPPDDSYGRSIDGLLEEFSAV